MIVAMCATSAKFRFGEAPSAVSHAFVKPPSARRFQVPISRLLPVALAGTTSSSTEFNRAVSATTPGGGSVISGSDGGTASFRSKLSFPPSEERLLLLGGAHVRAAEPRDYAPPRRALEEPELEQVRLVDVRDRVRLLAEGDGQGGKAHRAAVEALHDSPQQLAVGALEAVTVYIEQRERLGRHIGRDHALVAHLGDVAHASQDPVRDARGATRA